MHVRDIYIERLAKQLAELKEELSELENKKGDIAERFKDQADFTIDTLRQHHDAMEDTLAVWSKSSTTAWDSFEERADKQLETASKVVLNAIEHIKSFLK